MTRKKIKILKGLEKLCILGLLSGVTLVYAGAGKEKHTLSLVGLGMIGTSMIGGVYVHDKRTSIPYNEHKEYLEEERKRYKSREHNYNYTGQMNQEDKEKKN